MNSLIKRLKLPRFLFFQLFISSFIHQENGTGKAVKESSVVAFKAHHTKVKMKEEESQKSHTTITSDGKSTCSAASFSIKKCGDSFEELFGRGKFKYWALAAVILLALCSMFAGSVKLKFSSVDLTHSSNDLDNSIDDDLDALDVDDREKLVKELWNAYKYSRIIRLPSFFRDAFGAAYQDLTSEVSSVQNAAVLEIAKMSLISRDLQETPTIQSTA